MYRPESPRASLYRPESPLSVKSIPSGRVGAILHRMKYGTPPPVLVYRQREPRVIRPRPKMNEFDHVSAQLSVSADGHVHVDLTPPMWYLHLKYYSKGVMPPLPVYLKYMKRFGCTNEQLERCRQVFTKRLQDSDILDQFIDDVFGKSKK